MNTVFKAVAVLVFSVGSAASAYAEAEESMPTKFGASKRIDLRANKQSISSAAENAVDAAARARLGAEQGGELNSTATELGDSKFGASQKIKMRASEREQASASEEMLAATEEAKNARARLATDETAQRTPAVFGARKRVAEHVINK